MRQVPAEAVQAGDVALVGVPWDEQSSFLRGAAEGPASIRAALASPSTNWMTEDGRDLGEESRFLDLGDLPVGEGEAALGAIEAGIGAAVGRGGAVIALGGDHAVTYPLVRAQARRLGAFAILHLDAHPDLYDSFEDSRFSHACPFARIMEEGLATRLVQIGIRTLTPHLRRQAERFGAEVIAMRDWTPTMVPTFDGPVYLSLDLDALDPAHAPGVSHPEPGGLSTREVVRLIQQLQGRLVGADVVELNPARDPSGITAMVAAKLVKEIAARMLGGPAR